ncbi:hypothetical protein ACK8P5_20915 [Paenibacillus sp. EC2-1]|uniref:hypothetical protein n=1 Tax=Paenibacillus sp. EC2-1 TaxID=3388665 RepID=UPI003BEEBBDF
MTRENDKKEEELKYKDLDSGAIDTTGLVNGEMLDWNNLTSEDSELSRESTMFDIDRMVNEGLGGGNVTEHNGMIGSTTTDTMITVDETPRNTDMREENE